MQKKFKLTSIENDQPENSLFTDQGCRQSTHD